MINAYYCNDLHQHFLGRAPAAQAVNLLICERKALRPKANQILFSARTVYIQNAQMSNNYTTVSNLDLRSFLNLVCIVLVTELCESWDAFKISFVILSILQTSL